MSTRQCDTCSNEALVQILMLKDESSGYYCAKCALEHISALKHLRFSTDTTLYILRNRPLHS